MARRNRGKKTRLKQEMGRRKPTTAELAAARAAVNNSGPLVAAVLGGALVEYTLEVSIRDCVGRRDEDTWEKLIGNEGPFNTFHQKILFGYTMELYDAHTLKNLQIIKNIRNRFAHAPVEITFEDQLIQSLLRDVSVPGEIKGISKYALSLVKNSVEIPRYAFVVLCHTVMAEISLGQYEKLKKSVENLSGPSPIADFFNLLPQDEQHLTGLSILPPSKIDDPEEVQKLIGPLIQVEKNSGQRSQSQTQPAPTPRRSPIKGGGTKGR